MESEENTLVGLSRPMFNSIVDYLMSQPYGQVSKMIQDLQKDSQVITVAPEQKDGEPEQTSFESNKGGGGGERR
mgnify:CR=1 FL=1